MNRKSFLKTSGLLLAGAMTGKLQAKGTESPHTTVHTVSTQTAFPLMDLHVHRSKELTID